MAEQGNVPQRGVRMENAMDKVCRWDVKDSAGVSVDDGDLSPG